MPHESPDAAIERAAAIIADADALVIAAGAGMGVDSGLPDFRGNTGFWKAYPALAAAGTESHCGAIARPNILMFGDYGWLDERRALQAARCRDWLEAVRRPVVIELGAGLDIPTVRHFSQRVVLRHGGALVRINPRAPEGGVLATLAAIDSLLG